MFKRIEYWLCAVIDISILIILYWPLIEWFDKRVEETFEAQGITTAIILTLCGLINWLILRLLYRKESADEILKRLFKTTMFVMLISLLSFICWGIWMLSNR